MRGQLGRQVSVYFILAFVMMLGVSGGWQSLDAFEQQEAVKRAARRYRMQVFATFRADRLEYDRRVRIGNRILQQWELWGEPKDQADLLVDWFTQASQATKSGAGTPLPRYPLATVEDRSPSVEADAVKTPANEPAKRPVEEPANKPAKRPVEEHNIRRVPRTTQSPRRRSRKLEDFSTPANSLPPAKVDTAWTIERQPQWVEDPQQTPVLSAVEATTPDDGSRLTEKPNQPLPQTSLTDATGDLLKRREDPLQESSTVGRLSKQTAGKFSIPGPSPLPQHRADSPVDVPESLFDALSAAPTDPFSYADHRPTPSTKIVVASSVNESPVDLSVLAARIRASNLRLSEIESELAISGLWDVERLRPLVDQFESMLVARRLSQLYYQALDEIDRQRVAPFASIDATMVMLTQRLFEARAVATEDPVFFPADSREFLELQKLTRTVESWKN